jgi:hypothetical protein
MGTVPSPDRHPIFVLTERAQHRKGCLVASCDFYLLEGAGALLKNSHMLLTPEGSIVQACYAMGYNLAIEYLADYEKTWMLDSFRSLNQRVLHAQNRPLTDWLFLEVGYFRFAC